VGERGAEASVPGTMPNVTVPASPGAVALRRVRADRWAVASGVLFLILLALAAAAPVWANYVAETTYAETHLSDSIEIDGQDTYVVDLIGIPIGPTWRASFFLGADETGRDLMVRLLYGLRATLMISLGALALTLVLGLPLSLAAGYFRGRVDTVVSRIFDLIWSFPALLLGVLVGTALTIRGMTIGPITMTSGSKLIPILVIGLVYVPYLGRPLRAHVLSLRERQFVEAARASGAHPIRVMRTEMLPHLWSLILVLAPVLLANAIVLESALSFLGAGVGPPEPSLGTLISDGIEPGEFGRESGPGAVGLAPHLFIAPCVALVLLVLSLSGVAEGLRRALDPRRSLAPDLSRGQ
jgi:peptide/nickel transport system permease protein